MTKKYVGYFAHLSDLPVKRGQTVTIPKGTVIHTTGPTKKRIAKRTYKIKVHSVGCGQNHPEGHPDHIGGYSVRNPDVTWVGEGGYWFSVDINDVPEANA
jgi:hypothetical protein